jgi:hypothetical protein
MVKWEGYRDGGVVFVISREERDAWACCKARFQVFDVNWRQMDIKMVNYLGKILPKKPTLVYVTPPCPGVTRIDHVSWPAMEKMILTMMMMISMSTDGSPTNPLICLYSCRSTKAHHI